MVRFNIIFLIVLSMMSLGYTGSFKIFLNDNLSRPTQCNPSKIYKKDDVTCICNSDGRWPHEKCSHVFKTVKPTDVCDPDSYIIVDCNVCLCNKAGKLQKDLCTQHDCEKVNQKKKLSRRSNSKNKCIPNHWYTLPNCAVCYCINKNSLMCSNGMNNPEKMQILSKYNLTDCGTDFVDEAQKLVPVGNSLRQGNKKEKYPKIESEESQIQSEEFKTTPTVVTEKESEALNREDVEDDENSSVERNDISIEDVGQKKSNENSFELGYIKKPTKDKLIGRIAANTVIPFENEEEDNTDNDSNDSGTDNKENTDKDVSEMKKENESEDIVDHKPASISIHVSNDNKNKLRQGNENNSDNDDVQNSESPQQSDNKNIFELNLPEMLGRVFNFGSKRSLLSLDASKCVPGSTVEVECNTCFCMKNGKMLCTKNNCE